jgi:hypothetical protein
MFEFYLSLNVGLFWGDKKGICKNHSLDLMLQSLPWHCDQNKRKCKIKRKIELQT